MVTMEGGGSPPWLHSIGQSSGAAQQTRISKDCAIPSVQAEQLFHDILNLMNLTRKKKKRKKRKNKEEKERKEGAGKDFAVGSRVTNTNTQLRYTPEKHIQNSS